MSSHIQSQDNHPFAVPTYRPDIDGLRTIAVFLVILFHANFSFFDGGYIGVDVFFVISGYLITSILLKQNHYDSFSIVTFYERRIRRIFPALVTMLTATALTSYFIMMPPELFNFGKSLTATMGFSSNILFWRDAGSYFSLSDAFKPLLHTWSIAVEEQFYIFFPLYLYGVFKWCRRYAFHLTLLGTVASFALSVWMLSIEKYIPTFYLLPSRAWELLIGSLLAFHVIPKTKNPFVQNTLSIIGLLLIIIPSHLFINGTLFPGYNALYPTIGAALLIYTSMQHTIISTLLSTKPIVFLGKISYSLYLWHWPIFILGQYYLIRNFTQTESIAAIILCVILSALSWKYIEQPFRQQNRTYCKRYIFGGAFASIIIFGIIGLSFYINNGFPNRLPIETQKLAITDKGIINPTPYGLKNFPWDNYKLGETNKTTSFAVWGDSHANALSPGIDKLAKENNVSGILVKKAGCMPAIGMTNKDISQSCADFNEASFKAITASSDIKNVILIGRWLAYPRWLGNNRKSEFGTPESRERFKSLLLQSVQELQHNGKNVYIVAQTPPAPVADVASVLGRASFYNRDISLRIKLDDYFEQQKYILEIIRDIQDKTDVTVLYPHIELCNGETCDLVRDGKTLYFDGNHLSTYAAENIDRLYAPVF